MKKTSTTLVLTALTLCWAPIARGESPRETGQSTPPAIAEEQALQSLHEYQALAATSYEGVGVTLVDMSSSDDELVRRLREAAAAFQERQRTLDEAGRGQIADFDAREAEGLGRPAPLEAPSTLVERAYCGTSLINLCLLGRFMVGAEYSNPYLGPQILQAGALQLTFESGYLWWEGPTVMEVPIKMLNFCGSERVFKVFAAGLTNFYVRIVIFDAATGMAVEIRNPAYQIFNTFIGTVPFPC